MYDTNSPYSRTSIIGDYLDILDPRFIIHDDLDNSYVIEQKYDMRPDLLSYKLFGTAKLWWVFLMRNPDVINDPIQDFRAGTSIRIPQLKNMR